MCGETLNAPMWSYLVWIDAVVVIAVGVELLQLIGNFQLASFCQVIFHLDVKTVHWGWKLSTHNTYVSVRSVDGLTSALCKRFKIAPTSPPPPIPNLLFKLWLFARTWSNDMLRNIHWKAQSSTVWILQYIFLNWAKSTKEVKTLKLWTHKCGFEQKTSCSQ